MHFIANLWTAFIGVFRRAAPSEPDAGATLELSRTDIEIVDELT